MIIKFLWLLSVTKLMSLFVWTCYWIKKILLNFADIKAHFFLSWLVSITGNFKAIKAFFFDINKIKD
jgi:hypothetical protein